MFYEYRYTVSGPLFTNPSERTKNAVRQGIMMTATDGRAAAKRNSRVDTGRLRRGWGIRIISWDEGEIYNYVPYATIWEGRDGTLSRELPRLQTALNKNIGDALVRDLN